MDSSAAKAFDLTEEPAAVRDAYGRGRFGQGLPDGAAADRIGRVVRRGHARAMSREHVRLGHASEQFHGSEESLGRARRRLGHADEGAERARAARLDDDPLDRRVRPHADDQPARPAATTFPRRGPASLAAAASRAGRLTARRARAARKSSKGKVDVPDILATLCAAVGVDPEEKNVSEQGRPIKIAEGKVIREIVT